MVYPWSVDCPEFLRQFVNIERIEREIHEAVRDEYEDLPGKMRWYSGAFAFYLTVSFDQGGLHH